MASNILFLSLASGAEAGVEGVWKCNNFMLASDGLENAVFALASRINHSGDGGENAYWRWEGGGGGIGGERRIEFWSGRKVEVWVSFLCGVVVGELLIFSDCGGLWIGGGGNYPLL